MCRTRVRRRRVSMLVVGAMLAVTLAGQGARAFDASRTGAPPPPAPRSYVVRAGDTLWSIAERFSGRGDPRDVIDGLVMINHLDGVAIVPGQTLVVPPAR